MHHRIRGSLLLLCALTFAGCGARPAVSLEPTPHRESIAPEAATGYRLQAPVHTQHTMVGAANPHASRAGLEILRAGGSAVDAAIAMSLVLGLVEPQSSGIGGGGFLVFFEAGRGELVTYDGRETAPAAATPDMFLGPDGMPREFMDAVVGGLSVATPGLLRMLELAHRAHGRLPWERLFQPAIKLAEEGFEISPRLQMLVSKEKALKQMSVVRAYLYDEAGNPKAVGTRLVNQAYADVLRAVANGGADAFYQGPIAGDIVAAVRGAERNPGRLTLEDLRSYQAKVRPAVCAPVRDWKVCGMGPPSSGGVAVLQILSMLSHFDLAALRPDSVQAAHLFAEASRLAFADRGLYLADSDFVQVPVAKLIDPTYLKRRAELIRPDRTMGTAQPGKLEEGASRAPDRSLELPSTSHLVVVDAEGNAVSMTNTVEGAFGSRTMVRGFLLNNEMTDFSFVAQENGKPVANRIEPGKRPRSSMAPMIALDAEGRQLRLAVGSPGGSQIIDYVAQAMLSVRTWNMDIQRAIDRPHIVNRNAVTELEAVPGFEAWLKEVSSGLTALGHTVEVKELNSGLQGVQRTGTGYVGGADPRREGAILGD